MSRTGLVSKRMQEISKNTSVPVWALIVFTVVGVIVAYIAAPLPSIYNLIGDAVVAPPVVMALRRQGHKGFVKHSTLVSIIAFSCASAIIYWSGRPSVSYATILLTIAAILFGLIYRVKEHFINSI